MARTKKKTPLEILTEQYADHPVYQVVAPLRADAAKRAEQHARAHIEQVTKRLAECDGNFNAAYPEPSRDLGYYQREMIEFSRHRAMRLTSTMPGKPASYSSGGPYWVVIDAERCEKFVYDTVRQATDAYDMFVLKLVRKIGMCMSAVITGNHVWDESIITVYKHPGNDTSIAAISERWRTKEIENVSKLGKYFPQWPTRLMKR